ncbi:MAG: alkaline phosphatase [Saprospiraceae bacterium]|nr:alkaline phosphatase [Saprospiraceae bacterium]
MLQSTRRRLPKSLFLSIPLVLAGICLLPSYTAPPRPKNIILLIGDGMGLSQISAGFYANGKKLHLARFPVTGLMKTHSASHLITDSAAGATAFACGIKTYNGAIGVGRNKKPCLSILEQAENAGLATGLVATSSITHATPASFIAHVSLRSDMEDIAEYFLQTDLDFFIGGGMQYFIQRKTDKRNLYAELEAKGYVLSNYTEKKLTELSPAPDRPFGWFSANAEPDSANGGRDYLPLAAQMAPRFLEKRSEKGFFLMLEGSQIDWACHARNSERAMAEMLDFDAAIGEILRYAAADGNTLVIVTADHETGGLSLEQGEGFDVLDLTFNSGHHTATLVPVYAYGPGAEAFSGLIDNTEIYTKMAKLWGFLPENALSTEQKN